MSQQHNLEEAFLDDLAAVVDGEAAALDRWANLLADNEQARDLVHEARQIARRAEQAGADYVPPADLEQRVLGALGAQPVAAPVSPAAPVGPASAPIAAAPAPASTPAAQTSASAQVPTSGSGQSPAAAGGNVTPIAQAKRMNAKPMSGRVIAIGAVVSLGAVAAAAGLFVASQSVSTDGPIVASSDGITATLATIARSAGDGAGTGVIVAAPDQPQLPGNPAQSIVAGSTVRTDTRTRSELTLSDGSALILNQDTEVVIGEQGRSVKLVRGELVAEVAKQQGPNAMFATAAGRIEVVGTKFVLAATHDGASVRVIRGAVRALASNGASVEVKAGQEGLLRSNGAPEVVPAIDLAGSLGWSELDEEVADDIPVPGLGELRAKRPGEREESERPLTLAHHSVNVRIVGNVARTEIEETFRNDDNVELEGIYRFPMPPNARIASLALEVDGQWEQGAFVEKDRGQRIWRGVIRNATPERQRQQEEFIWVPGPWRDPALLEWQQGGRFELRIFPIPANGERRIRIAYEQTVSPHGEGRRYVYPLAHAKDDSARVGHFEVDVRVAGQNNGAVARGYELASTDESSARRLRYTRENFRPSGDLIVDYALPGGESELRYWTYRGAAVSAPPERSREGNDAAVAAQRALHEDGRGYAVFALRPELPGWTEAEQRDYVLVVDSSQSMVGERYQRATNLAASVVAEMDRRDRVMVVACDLTCRAMETGPQTPSSASANLVREFLQKVEPAGSSNLAMAVRDAAQAARRLGAGGDRRLHLVYVGDGATTVGHRRPGALGDDVRTSLGGAALTTVGIGQDADTVALSAMARAGGGHYIPFTPGQRTAAAALAVLETTYGPSLSAASLQLPTGLESVAPSQLPTVRAGQELLVAARMTGERVQGEVVLQGKVGGRPFEQRYPVTLTASSAAGNAFVPRMWASKTIESLELEGKSEHQARIIALSKGFSVMSRQTSLLVLESEAMFRAFGVDRAAQSLQWTGEDEMEMGQTDGTQQVASDASVLGGVGTRGFAGLDAVGGGGRGAASGSSRRSRNRSAGAIRAEARPSRAPTAEPAPSVPAEAGADDEVAVRDVREQPARRQARPAPVRPRRGGRWMRKVWFREGRISRRDSARERDEVAAREAEAALREQSDSRDRHRTAVRALSRAGQLARAEEVARAWISRDRLDPEALTYLSDVVGRQGKRDEALRILSGIVDLQPDNKVLQQRLANAYERAGKAELSCAHRVSLAELEADEQDVVAAAMRCEQSLGRAPLANRILQLVDQDDRSAVQEQARRANTPSAVRGDLLVDATWTGGSDVDVTLVTPQGTRLSWMGGRTNVVGDHASTVGRERVGLRRAGRGTYYIEVNRVDPTDRSPIRGQLRIRALGENQTIPFELTGNRTMVAQVSVVRRWRMENR